MSTIVQDHPVFKQPEDVNVKVWRFIDFGKFVDLLESNQLFLSRVDKLGDPFEGMLSAKEHANLVNVEEMLTKQAIAGKLPNPEQVGPRSTLLTKDLYNRMRSWTYVNCWHMNEHESAAMWKLYGLSNQAMVIRSTYSLLRQSFVSEQQGWAVRGNDPLKLSHLQVHIGEVQYAVHDDLSMGINTFTPFLVKRMSFQHERELRVLTSDTAGLLFNGTEQPEHGIRLNVDLNVLIEEIRVAPEAPGWFFDLVKKVVAKYGLSKPVEQSALDAKPMQ